MSKKSATPDVLKSDSRPAFQDGPLVEIGEITVRLAAGFEQANASLKTTAADTEELAKSL